MDCIHTEADIFQEKLFANHRYSDELWQLIYDLESTERYNDGTYPNGIFHDTSLEHTRRCVRQAYNCGLDGTGPALRDVVAEMLLIHNLADVTKRNDTVNVSRTGGDVALDDDYMKELFDTGCLSDELYGRYLEFRRAEQYFDRSGEFEGKTSWMDSDCSALVAKVIDIVDGNVIFHRQLAAWLASDRFDPEVMLRFPAAGLIYTFKRTYRVMSRITGSAIPDDAKETCLELLRNQLLEVERVWALVPDILSDRVPQLLQYLVFGRLVPQEFIQVIEEKTANWYLDSCGQRQPVHPTANEHRLRNLLTVCHI